MHQNTWLHDLGRKVALITELVVVLITEDKECGELGPRINIVLMVIPKARYTAAQPRSSVDSYDEQQMNVSRDAQT